MIKVFGIKNCDTMKKAMTWLDEQGVAYEFIDYKKAGVAASHLPDWCARSDWEALLNRRGLTWRKLSEEEKSGVDAAQAIALMGRYPSLIKRPVLDTGKELLLGFDPALYGDKLK